jgi:hypothetical protein
MLPSGPDTSRAAPTKMTPKFANEISSQLIGDADSASQPIGRFSELTGGNRQSGHGDG